MQALLNAIGAMHRSQANKMVMVADKPTLITVNGQTFPGPTLTATQLQAMIVDSAPEHLIENFKEGWPVQFDILEGPMPVSVSVATLEGILQVECAPKPEATQLQTLQSAPVPPSQSVPSQIAGVAPVQNVPPLPRTEPNSTLPTITPQFPQQSSGGYDSPNPSGQIGETTIFEITPSILPDIVLGCVTCCAGFLLLPWRYLTVLSCKYRLTTERLVVTAGIISKQSQELELYRVRDVTVELPFIPRMLGLGTVIVHASDSSSPRVELVAVPDAERVKEQIRQAARASRKAEGVRSVEYMPPA